VPEALRKNDFWPKPFPVLCLSWKLLQNVGVFMDSTFFNMLEMQWNVVELMVKGQVDSICYKMLSMSSVFHLQKILLQVLEDRRTLTSNRWEVEELYPQRIFI
jgi:hypothetical protein